MSWAVILREHEVHHPLPNLLPSIILGSLSRKVCWQLRHLTLERKKHQDFLDLSRFALPVRPSQWLTVAHILS